MNRTVLAVIFLYFNLYFLYISISEKQNHNPKPKWNSIEKPLLLLISFDGFRWNYLKMYKNLKNFNWLKKAGSHADFIVNQAPTLTYPNHWSIVTGLYPESHGVINNFIHDYGSNKDFQYSKIETHTENWFRQNKMAEPIWAGNLRAGAERRSAAEFPGANILYDDRNHIYIPTNHSKPYEDTVDEFIGLFTQTHNPINFGAMYFLEPDKTGHMFGPYSLEMEQKLLYLDTVVGYLINKLISNNLFEKMNLIITSDHGMEEIGETNGIYLSHYIDTRLFRAVGSTIVQNIFIKATKYQKNKLKMTKKQIVDYVYRSLKNIDHLKVWKRKNIPKEFHLKNNLRNGDILIVPDIGHSIVKEAKDMTDYWKFKHGQHGYVGDESSMYPLFIAYGPAFRSNFKIQNFKNVDIYPLMCHVLDVKPAPNNGSLKNTIEIMNY